MSSSGFAVLLKPELAFEDVENIVLVFRFRHSSRAFFLLHNCKKATTLVIRRPSVTLTLLAVAILGAATLRRDEEAAAPASSEAINMKARV
jgi:hypothetical protein